MNRSDFFKSLSAIIGAGAINSACDDSEDEILYETPDEEAQDPPVEEVSEYDLLKEKLNGEASLYEDKKLYLDLAFSQFDTLKTVGNFYNDLDNYVMILRKDEDTFLAFDNCCPHLGSVTKWSFANEKFTCSNHNNSFGINNSMIAPCSSGMTSGNLKQYGLTQIEDILIIDFNA